LDVEEIESDEDNIAPAGDTMERETASGRRNRDRVDQANATDQKLTSKHLPFDIDEFLPNAIPGHDDLFTPPAWLMEAIKAVAKTKAPAPGAPPVNFSLSEEAIQFNTDLLKDNKLSLDRLLLEHQHATLGFGSEFRPLEQLETILGQHPNFDFFSDVLSNGMAYHFTEELSEDDRQAEVAAMLERGNHKSAEADSDEVGKSLTKDVLHGFSLPVSPDIVPLLAGAMVQPAGVVKQFSLREDGARSLKRRLTQDLTFPLTFKAASVNNRINMDAYIHFIVALRLAHPLLLMFIVKHDYFNACR
jgi:hypothetical protein